MKEIEKGEKDKEEVKEIRKKIKQNLSKNTFQKYRFKIHDLILFRVRRSGAEFQALGSLAHQGQRFQSIQRAIPRVRSNRVYFGSVPALCTDIEAGKRKWKDHKLGLASSWGKGCQDVFPFFTACRLAPRISLRSLIKKIPQGCSTLFYVFHDVRFLNFFLSLFFSFFFASYSNSIVCHILP